MNLSRALPLLAAAGLVSAAALAPSASAQISEVDPVLLSDTFSRTTGSGDGNGNPAGDGMGFSDLGTNDNGLGGFVTSPYSAGPDGRAGGANQVTDGERAVFFNGVGYNEADLSALSDTGYSFQFDFRRFLDDTGSGNGFVSVGLGYDETVAEFDQFSVQLNSDFGVLFQQGANGNQGNANVFANGTQIGSFDYGDPLAEHTVVIDVLPDAGSFLASSTATAAVSVDGNSVGTFSVGNTVGLDTFAFASNGFVGRYVDDLVVTSLIPEPASAVLLGLGAVALLRRRK